MASLIPPQFSQKWNTCISVFENKIHLQTKSYNIIFIQSTVDAPTGFIGEAWDDQIEAFVYIVAYT